MVELLHLSMLLILPPLFLGVINKVKAVCAGRTGPPVLQLYWDLAKLFRKGMVISDSTTWIFFAGPVIGLLTAFGAGLFVPLDALNAPLHFAGDFILFAYLLGLGRFFTATSALDTGSAFEGMGAAREVTYATLVEPILFCNFIALSQLSSSFSLSEMLVHSLESSSSGALAISILASVTLFLIVLVEGCRIPFDDPNTHLELTMIHEVMVLDHSGPLFGLILYGAAIKLFVLSALFVDLLIAPGFRGGALGMFCLLLGVFGVSIAIGLIESTMARLKLTHIPRLLVGAFFVALFSIVLVLR